MMSKEIFYEIKKCNASIKDLLKEDEIPADVISYFITEPYLNVEMMFWGELSEETFEKFKKWDIHKCRTELDGSIIVYQLVKRIE